MGIEDERDGLSLAAIGIILNLSRERVRQLEVQALKKLRTAFLKAGHTEADMRAALQELAAERDHRGPPRDA